MATKRPPFGVRMRGLREARGLSVRTLARETGMSSTFLSKVERGEAKAPAEPKTRALARALQQGEDAFVLASGRVPAAWKEQMQKHPSTYSAILRCCLEAEVREMFHEFAELFPSMSREERRNWLERLKQRQTVMTKPATPEAKHEGGKKARSLSLFQGQR